MAESVVKPRIRRFGLFELDLQARELRKSGIRVKLHDQPFEILAMLLEHSGQVVSREQLQTRLWPADTFVDFDLSLNSAVKKLRHALNDDSDNPRFIETLYRRGYRFIGPVSDVPTQSAIPDDPAPSTEPAAELQWAVPPATLTNGARPASLSKIYPLSLLVVLALLLAAMFWATRSRPIRVLGYIQITHDGRPKGPMATDGERLYLTELENDHYVIAQVSAQGGETSIFATPFTNVFVGDIAPDGSSLLVLDFKGIGHTHGLWNLSLPSGTLRRVGDFSPSAVAWLPDGKHIAYAADSPFYIANADGSNPTRIASVNGFATSLAVSPDGNKFRFDLNDRRTQTAEIWEMDRNGSGLQPVLRSSDRMVLDCCGRWSRSGRYYVFQIYRNGTNNIWVLPERPWWLGGSRQPVQLTNGPLTFSYALPSPDGKKIFAIGARPQAEFVHFDSHAGLIPYMANTSATDLSFSADGQWIAYVSIPDETLWRSRVDGSDPLQLSPTSLAAALPRWSPDGKQIVFMARTEGTDYHAYLISANGGNPEPLAPGAEAGFDPNWSPDGKSIALTLTDPGAPGESGISVLDVASRKISQLPGSNGYFSPRYSPDGKYILAIPKDSQKLALFDRTAQRWSELIGDEAGTKGYPAFSHDGQYVYFDTVLTDDAAFYRIRIADRKLEKLFSISNLRRFQGELGSWTGLAPDDSPLLVRDMSSPEVYALDWQAP